MKTIAIIPARSGSKGLKDKNIKPLHGQPLLGYTIEAAKESGVFDCIHVSTDSKEYGTIAIKYGAQVPFLRSEQLATDTASTWDAIIETLDQYEQLYGQTFDEVVLLQPTSPLRSGKDIIEGYKLFQEKKAKAVVAVTEMDHSPLWSNTLPKDFSMENFISKEIQQKPRQALEPYYRINGALYIVRRDFLNAQMDLYTNGCYAYVMPKERSIDIDDAHDFKIAAAIGTSMPTPKQTFTGRTERVFVIAEAANNHNGSYENAKTLVDVAVEAGADCVKFQTFVPKELVSKTAKMAQYQIDNIGLEESQLEMIEKIALPFADFRKLQQYCVEKGILFLSTPFDLTSIEFLKELQMPFWKIPSGEITNYPYLVKLGATKRDMILSTGMCTLEEIEEAIRVLEKSGAGEITLLHCNTEYPTPYEDVNLLAMETLANRFHKKIGYSDHTNGIQVPIAAVALGAKIIEKHFTLDKTMEGPDHKASLEPDELKQMIRSIRTIESALGVTEKIPSPSEMKNINIARKSIVAKKDIKMGDIFSSENLTTKRPGDGINPMRWEQIIGTKASKDFIEEEQIVT